MLNLSDAKRAINFDILLSADMKTALEKWAQMYINQSPWLTDEIKSLNLAAAIAAEISRAVTIEMSVDVTGSARAEFLAAQMMPVMDRIRINTEYGCAKGGLMFKPYIKDGTIAVDYVQADQFFPVAFDVNGNMTACVFADQKTIGDKFYTRLEYHRLDGTTYTITNTAWKSATQNELGKQVPLAEVAEWAELAPEAEISPIEKPLFAYFKMPFANNVDPSSPLGVSVYSRATDLIEQADKQWSEFLWEFESAHRVLYTDPTAFGKGKDGKPLLPNKRLYRTLDLAARVDGQGLFEDWTPTIRETNLLNGLDAILKRIEFVCGLAQGTISNPETIALTATEIKMSRQRTYATITDTQKSLQDALDGLLYAMDVWATLGNLAPKGTYTTQYEFDDSIVADHDTQFTQDQQAVTMNVMPKWIFLTRNYGLSETDAKQWVAEAKPEPTNDFFPSVE